MRIKFNAKKALEVFVILDRLWKEETGVFEGVILPQNRWQLPEDPRDKANHLFISALPMRGGVTSEDPFRWIWELRKKYPGMFDPKQVMECWSPEKIREAMKAVTKEILVDGGVGENNLGSFGYKAKQHSEFWHHNMECLATYWGEDLRNVFWGVVDFEEAFRRINYHNDPVAGFRGMRRKIFSLLTIWLQEKELIPVFPTPIPVDFHALRILWVTGIIELQDLKTPPSLIERYETLVDQPAVRVNESLVDEIAKWSQGFLSKHGISHLHINPALWVLSRDFCRGHLQNSSREKGKRFVLPESLRQNPGLWPTGYRNPCAYCPIKDLCTGVVPSAPYYRDGLLVRMERVPVPHHNFFLPGIEPSYGGRKRSRNNA